MNRIESLVYHWFLSPQTRVARIGVASGLMSATATAFVALISRLGGNQNPGTFTTFEAGTIGIVFVTAFTVVASDVAQLMAWVGRRVARWGAPLLSLMGTALLVIPAFAFPPRARRPWLGEVLESLAVRRDHGSNWFMVLASYVRTWPSDLQDEWLDYLTSEPNDLDLAPAKGTAVTEVPGSYWKRHRTEIIWALIVGVVVGVILSPLGAIGYEAFTAWMHHRGVYWNWESPGVEA